MPERIGIALDKTISRWMTLFSSGGKLGIALDKTISEGFKPFSREGNYGLLQIRRCCRPAGDDRMEDCDDDEHDVDDHDVDDHDTNHDD